MFYQLKVKQQDRAWGEQRSQQAWGDEATVTHDVPGPPQCLVVTQTPAPASNGAGCFCLHKSLRRLGMGTWRDLTPWLEGAGTLSAGARGGSSSCPCPYGCGSSKAKPWAGRRVITDLIPPLSQLRHGTEIALGCLQSLGTPCRSHCSCLWVHHPDSSPQDSKTKTPAKQSAGDTHTTTSWQVSASSSLPH